MGPTNPKMEEFVIAMNLFAARSATRSVGFGFDQKRNVGFITMHWQIPIGNVLICHMTSKLPTHLHLEKRIFIKDK